MSTKQVFKDQAADNPSVDLSLQIVHKSYVFSPETRPDIVQDFGEDLFDPTGFVPLEVMLEQQRIAGEKAMLQRSMFDFEDWKEIYLETEKPDFDDEFSVMEYIREIEQKKQKLLEERQAELNEDFAAFMQSRRKKNATTINDDVNSSPTVMNMQSGSADTAESQVGSGDTSPASTD